LLIHPFSRGELRGNVCDLSLTSWKARCRLPMDYNWTVFASSYGWGINTSKSVFVEGVSHFGAKYQVEGANAVLRAFVSRDRSLLLRVYLVYVRPLVENNFVIWSPCLKQDIEAVERVQRRFTKRLPGLGKLSYAERLNQWICLALSCVDYTTI